MVKNGVSIVTARWDVHDPYPRKPSIGAGFRGWADGVTMMYIFSGKSLGPERKLEHCDPVEFGSNNAVFKVAVIRLDHRHGCAGELGDNEAIHAG